MMNQKGITILEVMISMLILVVGILGLAPLIGISIYGNTYSDDVGRANAIAQTELELLQNQEVYGSMPMITVKAVENGMYDVYSVVEDNTSNVGVPTGLYKIRVAITWNDNQQMEQSVYCTTYKLKSDL